MKAETKRDIWFGVGGLAVIAVSFLAIGKTLRNQELPSCSTQILELTNNNNFTQTMLLAPSAVREALSSSLPDNTLQKDGLITIAAGITVTNGQSTIFVKTFVLTKDNGLLATEIRDTLHKSNNNCRMLNEEYEVYSGSALM